jgi:hypothetical protein
MADWFVGQKIKCVAGCSSDMIRVAKFWKITLPTIGSVYHIREIISNDEGFGFLLSEISNAGVYPHLNLEPGFRSYCFRPLVEIKTDISIFHRMLNPSHIEEPVA